MADTESNAMATDQALYAIAACRYYQNGLSVWDFRASARTSLYEAQAGDSIYTAQAGSAAVLQVGSGTKELELKNIPIGNYDAAEIRVGDRVYEASAARNADGRRPVSETIPVEDGTVLEHTHVEEHGANHSHSGHGHGHTHTHENTKAVLNRLSRAIGHLESIRRMVEDGRDCSEVLIQLSAVRAAINNTGKVILHDHIQHCLVDAVEHGDTEALEELKQGHRPFY